MTKKIEWSKEYELGVPLIDSQHKKIVDLAGDLHDALTGNPEMYKLNMESILQALCDYTDYHFSTEEGLIEKHGYPGIAAHKLAHQNFIMGLKNQMRRLSSDSADSGFSFYEYVLSWLFTHIAKADKLWSVFLENRGISVEGRG